MIFDVDTTMSLPEAQEFFDMAVNAGHTGRNTRDAERKAKRLGKNKKYRNHFKAGTISGFSILNFVAKRGHVLLAKLLMAELGVNPNTTQYDETNRTTLHYAVLSGKIELVMELLNTYNSDVAARDICGSTPLHLAIFSANPEIAVMMINTGANVQRENHFGRAMHAAAFSGQLSVVTAIAEKHPLEVNVMVSGRVSPMLCALYGEEPECETFLIQRCLLEGVPLFYKIISFKNTEAEALELVHVLMQRGANPNSYEEALFEDLAIICAAKKGWSSVVSILLETTNRIADVDWNPPALIKYVNSDAFKITDAEKIETRVSSLKPKVIEELCASNALTALSICMSLRGDMNPLEWRHLFSLCQFLMFMWFQAYPVTCNPEDIVVWVRTLSSAEDAGMRNWAVVGTEGCLALSPSNPAYISLYDQLTGRHGASQD